MNAEMPLIGPNGEPRDIISAVSARSARANQVSFGKEKSPKMADTLRDLGSRTTPSAKTATAPTVATVVIACLAREDTAIRWHDRRCCQI